ncbi:MAG: helix-turn-helix domain-containing protein [Solirubrobacterales bacterium]
MTAADSPGATGDRRPPLTRREREILGLLAEGMSGAEIAAKLVLSPETVRTHVRNAMGKLGASTRSQAVVLAMQRREIAGEGAAERPRGGRRISFAGPEADSVARMLDALVSLYDVDGGAVYFTDEDGLSLRRATGAGAASGGVGLPETLALGDGPLGRVALERRAQLVHAGRGGPGAPAGVVAAPMLGGGRLLGLIALEARLSRPIGRSELLLLQAFANRVAEVLIAGTGVERGLERAMERFRSSWTAAGRG